MTFDLGGQRSLTGSFPLSLVQLWLQVMKFGLSRSKVKEGPGNGQRALTGVILCLIPKSVTWSQPADLRPFRPSETQHSSLHCQRLLRYRLSSQDYRNQINNNNNSFHDSLVFQIPQGHKPGTFPTSLAHKHAALSPIIDNTSVNWRTGSFHGYRGRHSCRRGRSSLATGDTSSLPRDVRSPLAALDHRMSIYDNVPDDQQLSGSEGGSGESVSDAERTSEESEVG